MNKDEWIINLTHEALNRLGRKDCVVLIVGRAVTKLTEGGGVREIPNWAICATDNDKTSARIDDFETSPEESDDQIKEKLVSSFSQEVWE